MTNKELFIGREPTSGMVTLAYIIYALHGFSAITGVMTSALVVTAFLTGWPSIIAVILSYAKRDEVRGTYLESHFEWMITTFWYALIALVVAGALFITVVLIPLSIVIIIFTGLWVLYRIARGVLNLIEESPVPLS